MDIDKILALFTRDNITLILAIWGALGSFASWVYTFASQRKNISVRIIENDITEACLFYILFENKSRLPIAITNISLLVDSKEVYCEPISTLAFEYTRRSKGEVVERIQRYTLALPITLSSLGATSGYVYFDTAPDEQLLSSRSATLKIYTNRGKAFQKKLELSDYSLKY